MKCKVSRRVYDASGQSERNINVTLNWVLGYFSKRNKNVGLVCSLTEAEDTQVEVEIEDDIAQKMDGKFGTHSEPLVSALLVVAYALGGAE